MCDTSVLFRNYFIRNSESGISLIKLDHENELITTMKSSNRLGFFSMARYGHPPEGKNVITSENVFSFFKYCVNFFFTKNVANPVST